MSDSVDLRAATVADRDEIVALLESAGLPARHLDAEEASLFVAREGDALLGCVGLERHGGAVLLRSLAVSEGRRGRGLGRRLVERLLAEARTLKATEIVLLTVDAAPFFEGQGFTRVERDAVDPALLDSWEFRHHACDQAVVMRTR